MDNETSFERHKKSVGDIGIGRLCSDDAKRDAIHFACAPVEAGDSFWPGQAAKIDGGLAVPCTWAEKVGIVDPFLTEKVQKGQRFWLILNPGSITDLRHHWEHPAFDVEPAKVAASPSKEASEQWLRDFVARSDCPSYEAVIAAAVGETVPDYDSDYYGSRNDGEYLHFSGRDAHGDIPPEFWTHVETVTGRQIPQEKRAEYFSCSC